MVAVTPSRIFNSAVDAVIPSNVFNSVVLTVAPSNIATSVVVKLLIVPLVDIFPVVVIFCEPKSGAILVPAIAAEAFTSASTIVPSSIFAEVI